MTKNALWVKFSCEKATFARNSSYLFNFFRTETVICSLIGYSDHFYILSVTCVGYWHWKLTSERITQWKLQTCKMHNVPRYLKIWKNDFKTEEQEKFFRTSYHYDSWSSLTHILLRFFHEKMAIIGSKLRILKQFSPMKE